MSLLRTSAVAALMTIASVAGASAADAIAMPVDPSPVEMPVYDDTGFDWNGFYAGIYGVGQWGGLSGGQYGLGIDAGVNAQFDFFLIGGEVALHGLFGGTTIRSSTMPSARR